MGPFSLTTYSMSGEFAIHHILSATSSKVSEVIERQLAIDPAFTQKLLYQGSIYCNSTRIREDVLLKKGDYLRVHTEPRRFPADKILWKETVLHEEDDFIIVQKPCGIPVHATVDNFVENVIFSLQNELGCALHVTQRLDNGTEGVLLLAKTKHFQEQFNKLLRERNIRKTYLARVENATPLGEHVHFMQQTIKAPKVLTSEPTEGWLECRLIIESVAAVDNDFDIGIQLLTGRTHQIRTQLSALGSPILGDKMYGSQRQNPWAPKDYLTTDSFALRAHRLEFTHPSKQYKYIFEAK